MDLKKLVVEAGMVDCLNMGGASCAYSHGCNGVTQEHLERFAALVQAAERERWRAAVEALAHSWDDPAEAYGMRLALKEGLRA